MASCKEGQEADVGLKHLIIRALGKHSHEWMDALPSSAVRRRTLPLSHPTLPIPAVLRPRGMFAGSLRKACHPFLGARKAPTSCPPSSSLSRTHTKRWSPVCTFLLTVCWLRTALSLRGSLLLWQREECEEGTAPDTNESEAQLGLLTAKQLPCGARKE